MKNYQMGQFKKGFALLELLLVISIVLFIFFKIFNLYLKKTSIDAETEKSLSDAGSDTRNYKTVLDSTKEKVGQINRVILNRGK